MNVESVIAQPEQFSDKIVSVFGRLVDYDGDVFLVAEDAPTEKRNRGIFVSRGDVFDPKYGAVVIPTAGGPLYEIPAEVTGIIGPSRVSPYPLEFSELREVKVDYDGSTVSVPL